MCLVATFRHTELSSSSVPPELPKPKGAVMTSFTEMFPCFHSLLPIVS